jgi:ATP-dependent exoDNAse (exonuclease V) alpha subunit
LWPLSGLSGEGGFKASCRSRFQGHDTRFGLPHRRQDIDFFQAIAAGETVLRNGDKVMQVRNNYEKEVVNGDMGILEVGPATREESEESEEEVERVTVSFPGARVAYGREELDQLVLAYATTIHKAQRSEYKGVVLIPIVRQHWIMPQRNLLYTAITWARERAVLVGQQAAVRRAVANVGSRRRYSRLAERLKLGQTGLPTAATQAKPEAGRRASPANNI